MNSLRKAPLWAVALSLTLAGSLPAQEAANDGALGFGYVANAPDMVVGGTVWGLLPGLQGWGLYVDAKMNPSDRSSDEYFRADLTPSEIAVQFPNDEEADVEERYRGVNVAVVKSVTNEIMVYAGGGYAYKDVYRRYLDPQRNRGQFGFYWVEDEESAGSAVNILAGALLRASERVRLQFGAETAPQGFTVGLSFMLGGW